MVTKNFGDPAVDLFATRCNAKCNVFYSWKRNPKASAVGAFTQHWGSLDLFYTFPPFSMILKTLRKIITEKATDILIVPEWPGQPWYPCFMSLLIRKPIVLKPSPYLLLSPCRSVNHPRCKTLALGLNCREIIGKAFLKKGFPEEAISLCLPSITESTLKQYVGSLREWINYCKTEGIDATNVQEGKLISFLTKKFNARASSGTLNSARSAISLISAKPINSENLSRFFKGIYRSRPSR